MPENVKIAGNHQKLGEKYGPDSPSKPLEGTNTDSALILDLWTPELWGNTQFLTTVRKFLLFLATKIIVTCYSSPRKWIDYRN